MDGVITFLWSVAARVVGYYLCKLVDRLFRKDK